MADIGEDWEMVERSSSYHSEESKMAWFLDNGFNIGKKIVITCALISSTPFLLPPLLLISAIGFALSVPSGILLSSYACTKKIMSKLLPRPDHPLMLERGECLDKSSESEYQDFVEKKDGSGYEEDVGEYLDIEGNGDKPDVIGEGNEEQPIGPASVAKDDIDTENKDDKERVSVKNRDEKDIGVTVVEEKTMTSGNEKNKNLDKKKRGNKKENMGTEQEVLHQTNAGTRDIGDKSPEGTAELRSSEEVAESKQTMAYPTGKGLELSEGSIKEKIEALRVIVGYRGVPHKTYIGELRALYMFTGVEPPTPFKHPCDLSDVIDKLEFLMSSVIGVK